MEIIASFTRSACSVAMAASRIRSRETLNRRTLEEMSMASPRGEPFIQPAARATSGARVLGVGFDDLAHEAMPDDVGVTEVVKADTVDPRKNPLDLDKPRLLPVGKVDLGFVARDHRFRVNAKPSEKHLHLRGGRVLRFVKNDKGVGEGASTHVRQR